MLLFRIDGEGEGVTDVGGLISVMLSKKKKQGICYVGSVASVMLSMREDI